jgi:hypothetical protein
MAYAIEDVAAIQSRLLSELETGRSLRQVCSDEGMPHLTTVLRWVAADAGFASRYTRARTAQADTLFDRMEAVEEAVSGGTMDSHAARVVLDSMRWRASKLAPKVYGDRMAVDVTETRISISAALDAANARCITINATDMHQVQEVQEVQRLHTINASDVQEVQEVQEVKVKKPPWPRPKPPPEPLPVHTEVQVHATDARAARMAKMMERLGKR